MQDVTQIKTEPFYGVAFDDGDEKLCLAMSEVEYALGLESQAHHLYCDIATAQADANDWPKDSKARVVEVRLQVVREV